jgi:hypothetical protein
MNYVRIPQGEGWTEKLRAALDRVQPPISVVVGNAGMAFDAQRPIRESGKPAEIVYESPWTAYRILPDLYAALLPYLATFTDLSGLEKCDAVLMALECEGFD